MKKLLLFIFNLFIVVSMYAQWETGGRLLSDTSMDAHNPVIHCVNKNFALAAWLESDSSGNKVKLIALSENGEVLTGWPTNGKEITPSGEHYNVNVLALDSLSGVVVWSGIFPNVSSNYHIWIQKFSLDGSPMWNSGNPVQVSSGSTHHHKLPFVIPDGQGGVFVAWTRYDLNIAASSPDVFVQHILSDGSKNPVWPDTGIAVAITPNLREYWPRICLNNNKKYLYVSYFAGLPGNVSLKIHKISVNAGTLASNWVSPITVTNGPDVIPDVNKELYLYVDSMDKAVVFWLEARWTLNGEIYMQKVDSNGTSEFQTGGKILVNIQQDGTGYFEAKPAGDGNFLLAFNNYQNFYDLGFKKVNGNGSTIWTNLNFTGDGESAYPEISILNDQITLVFYKHMSSVKELKVFAINKNGNLLSGWSLPGTNLGKIGTYNAFFPDEDFDVSGSEDMAFVIWDKLAGSRYDVMACNVYTNGSYCSLASVPEMESDSPYSIYPNPCENMIFIENPQMNTISINLYDLQGKNLLKKKSTNSIEIILLDQVKNGIYILSIDDGKAYYKFKIVKTK